MLCDVCKEKPATVHYTEIINNKLHKMDLCEECAQQRNLGIGSQFSVADILKGLTESVSTGKTTVDKTCSSCGLTYTKFKKVGKLGCGDCYKAFEEHLQSVISDIHRNSAHVGKNPTMRAEKKDTKASKLNDLYQQLQQAVQSEEYEKAAVIRDTIKGLETEIDKETSK